MRSCRRDDEDHADHCGKSRAAKLRQWTFKHHYLPGKLPRSRGNSDNALPRRCRNFQVTPTVLDQFRSKVPETRDWAREFPMALGVPAPRVARPGTSGPRAWGSAERFG